MKRNTVVLKGLVHLGIGFLVLRLVASPIAQQAPPATCCFEHDGYQGTCVVSPGEGETCESILEYLNKPGTVGKSYCGGSRLRGNWKSVPCPATHQAAVATTPGSD